MIIKIVRTASSANLLNYLVNQDHEILDAKGVSPFQNIEEIINEFKARELMNQKAENIAYNIIVSFPTEDQIDESTRLDILEEVMEEFNGGSDLWFAVSHRDSQYHHHFHSALSAIKLDGLSIDMSNFASRAIDLSRQLEIKYSLKRIESVRSLDSNKAIADLRFAINHSLVEAESLDHFTQIMLLNGYLCKVGRGITFIKLENNHPIKGSDVDRKYSLGNLKKYFESNENNSIQNVFHISNNLSKPREDGKSLIDILLSQETNLKQEETSDEENTNRKKKRKKRRGL